jgi:hypothetical protein
MIERTEQRFDIKPERLAGDTAYGSGANLNWLVNEAKIAPHARALLKVLSKNTSNKPGQQASCPARPVARGDRS